jgi:hypothetical protein
MVLPKAAKCWLDEEIMGEGSGSLKGLAEKSQNPKMQE